MLQNISNQKNLNLLIVLWKNQEAEEIYSQYTRQSIPKATSPNHTSHHNHPQILNHQRSNQKQRVRRSAR